MSEDLTDYYENLGVKVRYLHSDIKTLERVELIRDLRKGDFNVLIGINLLREGLDIRKCLSLPSLMLTKKASSGPSAHSSRPVAGPLEMPTVWLSCMQTKSPGPCNAPLTRPSADE